MNILFVYLKMVPFVKRDIDILKKHYTVTVFHFSWNPFSLMRLYRLTKKNDLIFTWFASYQAFIISRITKKPLVINSGGYDVANVDNIGYGISRNWIFKKMVKSTIKKAWRLLMFSASSMTDLRRLHKGSTNTRLVYPGVDTDFFVPLYKPSKTILLTVGYVDNESWKRKGFDRFCELAHLMEGYDFFVVGSCDEKITPLIEEAKKNASNLRFTGHVTDEELREFYQMSKVYLQLSEHEGFGLSVAEAMSCECIPVVSNRYSLPEVVGDTGLIVHLESEVFFTDLIERVHKAEKMDGKKCRERVKENFSIKKRENSLCGVINEWKNGK